MWEHGKNTGWPYVLLGETGIRAEKNGLPRIYQLYQNSPNPFNSETKIIYFLPQSCHVNLTVYDTAGRTVSTLVNKFQTSGMYYKVWDAVDSSGMEVPSGVYFCCIKIENYLHTIKMILMR
jgi:hypothetical protein